MWRVAPALEETRDVVGSGIVFGITDSCEVFANNVGRERSNRTGSAR